MSYAYTSADGLARSNDRQIIETWDSIGARMRREESAWIADLRSQGVRAAHPDDGWVDRERNEVRFMYPQFNDGGIEVGSLIALGWPDRFRLVRVTGPGTHRAFLLAHDVTYFAFEDAAE